MVRVLSLKMPLSLFKEIVGRARFEGSGDAKLFDYVVCGAINHVRGANDGHVEAQRPLKYMV